jgi:hypothetical protein
MFNRTYGSLSPTITLDKYPSEIIVTSSVTQAVTVDEVKVVLPVYDNQTLTFIEMLIPSVQRRIEDYVNRDTTLRTRMALWSNPDPIIILPYGVHGNVSYVERYEDGHWVDYEDYEVYGLNYKYLDIKKTGKSVRVSFQSGGGNYEEMKQAILQEIAYQFKNRNDPNEAPAVSKSGLSIPTLNILAGIVR